MLYHYKGDTFKIDSTNDKYKLYHKAVNRWSSGWTYIGIFKTNSAAESAARQYTS